MVNKIDLFFTLNLGIDEYLQFISFCLKSSFSTKFFIENE